MPTRSRFHPQFQLEMLESRTLLAGDLGAITSSGAYLSNLDSDPTNPQITIVGLSGGQLVLDAKFLPATAKDLRISGFQSVTVTGPEKLDSLDLSRIGTFVGSEVEVKSSLRVTDVANVILKSIAGFAMLSGKESRLEVADSRSATIYSTLDRLTLSSKNDLMLLSGNPNQEIRLEFLTNGSSILGPTRLGGSGIPTQTPPVATGNSELTPPTNPETSVPARPIGQESPGLVQPGVTEPQGSTQQVITPSELTSDALHTFTGISNGGQSSYTVIVISLSGGAEANLFLLKLQNAVKQGDVDGVKNAFAEYVKNVRFVGTMSYGIASNANIPIRIEVPAMAEISRHFEPSDRPTASSPGISAQMEIAHTNPNMVDVRIHVLGSPEDLSFNVSALESERMPVASTVPIETKLQPEQDHSRATPSTDRPIVDQVRSGLSTLITQVDAHVSTVSSYIMDRFGNEFLAGELPVLLVDAKPSRSAIEREINWVQI